MNITEFIAHVAQALKKAETTVQIKNIYLSVFFFWSNLLTGIRRSVIGGLVHILPLTS